MFVSGIRGPLFEKDYFIYWNLPFVFFLMFLKSFPAFRYRFVCLCVCFKSASTICHIHCISRCLLGNLLLVHSTWHQGGSLIVSPTIISNKKEKPLLPSLQYDLILEFNFKKKMFTHIMHVIYSSRYEDAFFEHFPRTVGRTVSVKRHVFGVRRYHQMLLAHQ